MLMKTVKGNKTVIDDDTMFRVLEHIQKYIGILGYI